jgi:hypothetical protein
LCAPDEGNGNNDYFENVRDEVVDEGKEERSKGNREDAIAEDAY